VWKTAQRLMGKYGLSLALDVLSVVLGYYLALALRFTGRAPVSYMIQFRHYILAVLLTYVLVNAALGLYNRIWRYASSEEIVSIVESVAVSTLLVTVANVLWKGVRPFPLSVVLAGGLFTLGGFAATRYRARLLTGLLRQVHSATADASAQPPTRVLLVGAGEAGQLLAWRLLNRPEGSSYQIVGFVDDDVRKQGMIIHGCRVLGSCSSIPMIVSKERVGLIVIAIHTISRRSFDAILSICQTTPARIKTLPDLFDSLQSLSDDALLRDIDIGDLVGRELVSISREDCRRLLTNKHVLVTGAAGSIGSGLCQQIIEFAPGELVMLDNNETGLYELEDGLRVRMRDQSPAMLRTVVADVTDRVKIDSVLAQHHPDIVVHAAAYKHVPLMELWPEEAVRVNVGGTLALLELSKQHGVQSFVFVSTDKAVDPASAMGASKRLGEIMVTAFAEDEGMVASSVRFGNVLGSRGSVVPTFQRQIDLGRPVSVTHPDATRFFMSLDEAAKLVLQAASMASGGEVFIPDMGEEIKIVDLAHKMIRLRGLRVHDDVPIVFTGLRPGEKLHETLSGAKEEQRSTAHPRILSVHGQVVESRDRLLAGVQRLLLHASQGVEGSSLRAEMFALLTDVDAAHTGAPAAPLKTRTTVVPD
jgi:FlaA1/EpsC-like NDP-sugar epimerase